MTTKLDMHLHTPGSDGTGRPSDFVQAIQKAGLDGIVVTDHHRTLTNAGLEVIKAVRAAGLIALVGCEYSTKEGHCLVYGVDVMKLGLGMYPTMQQLIDAVAERGGVAFPSHPYRGVKETLGDRIYQLKNLTHAEAFNGQNEAGNGWASSARPEANKKAVWAAEKMGLGQTGGSDAHQPGRIGTCFTEFTGTVKTVRDLIAALQTKDHRAVVNQVMVDAQKAEAAASQRDWERHPDTQKARWRSQNEQMSLSNDPPWWRDEDADYLSRLDRDSGESYSGHGYEEDAGYGGGLDDDRIPADAFDDGPGIDDPEAVQRFLLGDGKRKPKKSPKRKRSR